MQAQDSTFSQKDSATRQKDIVDIAKSWFGFKDKQKYDSLRSNKKFHFSILPAPAAVPGGGAAFATSTNMAFYLGPTSTTALSNITFTPYTNFNGRFVFPLRSNIWFRNNNWNLVTDMRYMIYPQYSWGLGGNTPEENKSLISYDYLRLHGNILRRIGRRLLIGGGFEFDHHFSIELDSGYYHGNTIYEDSIVKNSTSSGFVVNILYDSRKNALNPQGGWYLSLETRFNQTAFGSDKNWDQLYVDVRRYFSFSRKRQDKLALWSYLWTVIYGKAPYLDLPSIGWDTYGRSGRGYLQNRYRSNALLYFESEYRRDITRDGLLGFVLFANLHSVTEYRTSTFTYWHPAGGIGLRFKLNKYSGTNITLDYGFSKTYNGVYLNIGETF